MTVLVVLSPQFGGATTTGLNNIPTADVVPANVLVVQQFTNFGADQQSLFQLGAKYGPAENWEIGLDRRIRTAGSGLGVSGAGGMPAGPWVFQTKYRWAPQGTGTSVALGIANLGEDTSESGDSFPYAVVTQDLRWFRGTLGYGGRRAGRGFFAGADKTLKDGTMLRADWLQSDDRNESVASFGFLRPLAGPWLIEAWASFPTADGVENTFTVKFDYVINFGH